MKTLQRQILQDGGEESTCSPEGSLASPSASPDEERERMTTATSGRKCFAQYGRYDRLGSSVRMLLESSRWYNPAVRLKWNIKPLCSKRVERKQYPSVNTSSRPSAATSSVKDIPSSRLLFRLVPSARRTAETGSSLLPTVQTQGLKRCNAEGKTEFLPLGMLPTPNASEGEKYATTYNPKPQTGKGLTVMDVNGLLPTPTSIDSGSGCINKSASPGAKERPTIALAAKMGLLPTPMSTEVRHERRVKELKEAEGKTFHSRANGETRPNGLMDFLDFHGMLLTPRASDGVRANFTMESLRNCNKPNAEKSNLSEQIAHKIGGGTSQLNPLFVEEMMGFPSMWSVLPFLSQNGGREQSKDTETR